MESSNKLVELKDNQEQWCAKAGETIYLPWEYNGVSGIANLKITRIIITEKAMRVITDFETDDEGFFEEYNGGIFDFSDFGKIVFFTRSEAEEALVKTTMYETEVAVQLEDVYIGIKECSDGYDYTIYRLDFSEIDGGVYDNPDISIWEALEQIVSDIKESSDYKANENTEIRELNYSEFMRKVEGAENLARQRKKGR